jgi:hypothetical protein
MTPLCTSQWSQWLRWNFFKICIYAQRCQWLRWNFFQNLHRCTAGSVTPGNFGTDPDHWIRSRKNGYGYMQLFMDFWHKSYLFWWYWNARKFKMYLSYPVKILISSQFPEISRNKKNYFAKYEINISRNLAKFRDRKISSTTLSMHWRKKRIYSGPAK